jgi:single-stranded DNA-binding protein
MNTTIKGRITGDVVVETLESGKTVANIRIADNKAYIDKQGKKHRVTSFYNVKLWNGVADALGKTAGKGDLVKFKVNVQPNSYLSEKKQEVINELVMTANRFRLVRQARANRNN